MLFQRVDALLASNPETPVQELDELLFKLCGSEHRAVLIGQFLVRALCNEDADQLMLFSMLVAKQHPDKLSSSVRDEMISVAMSGRRLT